MAVRTRDGFGCLRSAKQSPGGQKDRAAALDYQSYGSLIADLNTTTLKEWVDAGVLIFTHVAKAGDLIYVPTGWSGVEQTRPEQRLDTVSVKVFCRTQQRARRVTVRVLICSRKPVATSTAWH